MDLQQGLRMAVQYLQAGHAAQAEALYRQLLSHHPHQPQAMHGLGGVLLQSGRPDDALPLLEEAKQLQPGNGQHWLSLGQCLLALGRAKDAKKVISEAIRLGLRHPLADELLKQARSGQVKKQPQALPMGDALRQLEALLRTGRHGEAERFADELVRRHPNTHVAWYQLGMARLLGGRPKEAVEAFRHATELKPQFPEAHFNLGYALQQQGLLDDALVAYRQALAHAPSLVEAQINLGFILHRLERNEEAIQVYRALLRKRPDLAEVWTSLASVYNAMDRYEEALSAAMQALNVRPQAPEALRARANALHGLDRYEEAVQAYRRLLQARPEDADAWQALGVVLDKWSHGDEARAALERALALRPGWDAAVNTLTELLLKSGDSGAAFDLCKRYLAHYPDGLFTTHSNLLLLLNYERGTATDAMLAEAMVYGAKVARLVAPRAGHGNDPAPERRLRVGLVSGDLGQHPVGYFLLKVLESLDAGQIELFAYATVQRKDPLNARLRRWIPHWCEATKKTMDDNALAKQIQSDGIDILIDLAGHTAKNRLPLFAWKPAPIQVTWLGYLGTTGVEAIDYVLADSYALPVGEENQFVETPWRLPESYICFSPPELPVEVGQLPALKNGFVTFGCFNNLKKINRQVVACWAELLNAVPASRLYLKTKGLEVPEAREATFSAFQVHGISAERLILEGQFASHEDHFRAYQGVDIALDPFPYPGITTSVEALWMGVPVLALKGDRFISHQGETILHNVGLPAWIADSEAEYVAKAAAFASDLQSLAELRAGLRAQLLASPLCDAPRFARNFEEALRAMWRKWCAEQGVRPA